MIRYLLAAGAFLVLGTNAAFPHITLETQEAAVGSTYKAVLRGRMVATARRRPPYACRFRKG